MLSPLKPGISLKSLLLYLSFISTLSVCSAESCHNLNGISTQLNSTTILHAQSIKACIATSDWVKPALEVADCEQALSKLSAEEKVHGGRIFEFESPGASRQFPGTMRISTPRKYVNSTCTIALVMMKDFLPGMIPGSSLPPRFQWRVGDLATFPEARHLAKVRINTCCRYQNRAGWTNMGQVGKGVGVFVLATGSVLDQYIDDIG